MKKTIITILAVMLIIPAVTYASWWNPFSWFGSNDNNTTQTESVKSADSGTTWWNPFTWFGSSGGDSAPVNTQTNLPGNNNTANSAVRYIDNGDGSISDSDSGLTWMKCDYGTKGSDCSAGSSANAPVGVVSSNSPVGGSSYVYGTDSATAYCNNGVMCKDGTFKTVDWKADYVGNHSEYPTGTNNTQSPYVQVPDTGKARACGGNGGVSKKSWRVPSIAEIKTLYDQNATKHLDSTFFPNSIGMYITSTGANSNSTVKTYLFANNQEGSTGVGAPLKCVSNETGSVVQPPISTTDLDYSLTPNDPVINKLLCDQVPESVPVTGSISDPLNNKAHYAFLICQKACHTGEGCYPPCEQMAANCKFKPGVNQVATSTVLTGNFYKACQGVAGSKIINVEKSDYIKTFSLPYIHVGSSCYFEATGLSESEKASATNIKEGQWVEDNNTCRNSCANSSTVTPSPAVNTTPTSNTPSTSGNNPPNTSSGNTSNTSTSGYDTRNIRVNINPDGYLAEMLISQHELDAINWWNSKQGLPSFNIEKDSITAYSLSTIVYEYNTR